MQPFLVSATPATNEVFDMTIAAPQHLLPSSGAHFGHPLRRLWSLDPAVRFLNHGSFGATPHHVLAAQSHWREALEREPVRFMVDELPAALRAARARLAGFVGAAAANLAFVENATAGGQTALPSLRFAKRGSILLRDHAHPTRYK